METYFAFPGSLRLSHYFHLRLLPLKLECGLLFVDHKWWWKLEVELGLEWLVHAVQEESQKRFSLLNQYSAATERKLPIIRDLTCTKVYDRPGLCLDV